MATSLFDILIQPGLQAGNRVNFSGPSSPYLPGIARDLQNLPRPASLPTAGGLGGLKATLPRPMGASFIPRPNAINDLIRLGAGGGAGGGGGGGLADDAAAAAGRTGLLSRLSGLGAAVPGVGAAAGKLGSLARMAGPSASLGGLARTGVGVGTGIAGSLGSLAIDKVYPGSNSVAEQGLQGAALGAATGAGFGLMGGPFSAVTVPGGALVGGILGGLGGIATSALSGIFGGKKDSSPKLPKNFDQAVKAFVSNTVPGPDAQYLMARYHAMVAIGTEVTDANGKVHKLKANSPELKQVVANEIMGYATQMYEEARLGQIENNRALQLQGAIAESLAPFWSNYTASVNRAGNVLSETAGMIGDGAIADSYRALAAMQQSQAANLAAGYMQQAQFLPYQMAQQRQQSLVDSTANQIVNQGIGMAINGGNQGSEIDQFLNAQLGQQ